MTQRNGSLSVSLLFLIVLLLAIHPGSALDTLLTWGPPLFILLLIVGIASYLLWPAFVLGGVLLMGWWWAPQALRDWPRAESHVGLYVLGAAVVGLCVLKILALAKEGRESQKG